MFLPHIVMDNGRALSCLSISQAWPTASTRRVVLVTLCVMGSPGRPLRGLNADDNDGVRAAALNVVLGVLGWRLAATRWDAVGDTLDKMDAALTAHDKDALNDATTDLDVAGPSRIAPIGATPVVPPPAPVRDLLNRLVHELGGTTAADWKDAWNVEEDGDAACS